MKRFILFLALLITLVATYAQYTIRIIPIIDRRIEIGGMNMFNIYSFTGNEEPNTQTQEMFSFSNVKGGLINPGAYFGYGYTIDWNRQTVSAENIYKVGFFKSTYTLLGESWNVNDPTIRTPMSIDYEKLYIHIQGDIVVKFHLLDDQLETGAGIAGVLQVNVNDFINEEPRFTFYPIIKGTYKLDQFYISGTVGFDLLKALNFNIMKKLGYDDSIQHVKITPILLSLSVGYAW